MRPISKLLLAATLLATTAMTPAMADDHHDRHGHEGHFEEHVAWRGDISHFHEHDFDHWRSGRWFNGDHDGRHGWWWIIDGGWYFYPAPVYPYPDPYTPPLVVEQVPVGPAVAVAPTYVYYCSDPVGYYPYVVTCFHHWRRVLPSTTIVTAPQPEVIVQQPPVVQPPIVQPSVPVMPPAASMGSQRDQDDRTLNNLAVEFQYIDLTAPHAAMKLKALEKKVEAFRQSLYSHGYNAMDILKDADGLEHRIAEQRERLSERSERAPMARAPVEVEPLQQ